jgi:hypothetical protein
MESCGWTAENYPFDNNICWHLLLSYSFAYFSQIIYSRSGGPISVDLLLHLRIINIFGDSNWRGFEFCGCGDIIARADTSGSGCVESQRRHKSILVTNKSNLMADFCGWEILFGFCVCVALFGKWLRAMREWVLRMRHDSAGLPLSLNFALLCPPSNALSPFIVVVRAYITTHMRMGGTLISFKGS